MAEALNDAYSTAFIRKIELDYWIQTFGVLWIGMETL